MALFAEGTNVPVTNSRTAIAKLLQDWGCTHIQWVDDFEHGVVTLRFVWKRDNQAYLARFSIQLKTDKQLEEESRDNRPGRRGAILQSKLDRLKHIRGCQEHRLLLLKIKADLNAVAFGMISAETVFLPFLEGADGNTVAEVAIPQLHRLLVGSADRLLPGRTTEDDEP